MKILEPTQITIPENQILAIRETIETTGKRVGGGTVKTGEMTLSELASSIVPYQSGFNSRKKQKWESPEEALQNKFKEFRWTPFEKAIVIAVVKRFSVDPQDGYIPLAPGEWDIEAAFNPNEVYGHQEIVVRGQLRKSMVSPSFPAYGLASEFGNLGDSIEFIFSAWVDEIWEEIIDTQRGRETAMVIVTPHDILLCEKMSINYLRKLLPGEITVKTRTAIEMAENISRNLK